jgi:hypothetical protein
MIKKNKGPNPHCPVAGCRTTQPHLADPTVQALMREFGPPDKTAKWTLAAMAELAASTCRELREKNVFAFHTRIRQPEELYIRTLYTLFVASDAELPHIISGATPNGLSRYYESVNKVVFEGRGLLQVSQPGLNYGTFKPIDTLHDGAHASFRSYLTCIGWIRNPEHLPSADDYSQALLERTRTDSRRRALHEVARKT